MMFTVESARALLQAADVFFETDDEDTQTLNMSDTWGWACADGEEVPDEELPRVAELFFRYGWCGLLWWVSERRGGLRSQFRDVNRFVQFVRHEEAIRRDMPNSSERAFAPFQYTVEAEP